MSLTPSATSSTSLRDVDRNQQCWVVSCFFVSLYFSLPASLAAQDTSDAFESSAIPIGIEAATTYRSDYLIRGQRNAGEVLDFQMQAGYSFSNQSTLDLTAWRVQGTSPNSNRDYTENGVRAYKAWNVERFQLGIEGIWRDQQDQQFDEGLELGPALQWQLNPDLKCGVNLTYLNSSSRWYGQTTIDWSRVINEKAFWGVQAVVGITDAFASSNEWHQAGLICSYSYALLSQVSIVPYAGYSLGLSDSAPDLFHGGIRLQLRF